MSKLRVVVIDDEEDLRTLAVEVLTADGRFEVVGVGENGHEAVDLAIATMPDVVLLDLEMPWLHGAEAVPYLRRVVPAARIILWTVAPDSQRAADARSLGATGVIDKAQTGIRGLPLALVDAIGPGAASG